MYTPSDPEQSSLVLYLKCGGHLHIMYTAQVRATYVNKRAATVFTTVSGGVYGRIKMLYERRLALCGHNGTTSVRNYW